MVSVSPHFTVGQVVHLKKKHPCGSDEWEITRLGADIGLRCKGCGRSLLLPRATVERRTTTRRTGGSP